MNSFNPDYIIMIPNLKIYLIGGLALVLLFAGVALGGAFRKPDIIQENLYSRMQDVKHVKRLELVTYYFESMVDVAHQEKTDKVYLLMIIPARVSCYIDLEQMSYTVEDSLIKVSLPGPQIEAPVLDLDSARLFNMNQRYVTASKKSYETVVRNVQHSLLRAKEDVLKRAEVNGIKDEARRLGEGYFRVLFAGLGYDIQFEEWPQAYTQSLISN